jgi:heptosyltransferase-1
MRILIVRLGALGDIVHAIPAAAALRAAMPSARIDWLVDAKHREILDLTTVLDSIVTLDGRTLAAWGDVTRRLRAARYDVALDFQGLLKSAVLARASGARRVAGFSIFHLREKTARPFYTDARTPDGGVRLQADQGGGVRLQPDHVPAHHVITKNLQLLQVLGVDTREISFPLARVTSAAAEVVRGQASGHFALLNPGAAWPNKRWPSERFGELATFLRDVRALTSFVLWGPGEQDLADAVVRASSGAARAAPATRINDLVQLSREAALMVSGDTGPLHIAAAMGTPVVGLFGPTDPDRNGPWRPDDEVVSRFGSCGCHYDRRCHQASWCLGDVTVAEVSAAVQQRLSRGPSAPSAAAAAPPLES